ncbi:MAG: hypothetical protein HY869_01445 [Chloroflexi bacterium]|nr:hypothetical protein [Chloroflexota bacterium]
MSAIDFYIRVVKSLDEIEAPYMIVGAFAGLVFGVSRATFDVDILVDLQDDDFVKLSSKFPLPRYYADPEMMRNSVQLGIMFNIIDTEEGVKADLVPLTREPGYDVAFERRVRRTFSDTDGNAFDAWCAQPTDIVTGKLKAWKEGQSSKHPTDIYNMLVFSLSGFSDLKIDMDIVSKEAQNLGERTFNLWNELVARAQTEIQNRP